MNERMKCDFYSYVQLNVICWYHIFVLHLVLIFGPVFSFISARARVCVCDLHGPKELLLFNMPVKSEWIVKMFYDVYQPIIAAIITSDSHSL